MAATIETTSQLKGLYPDQSFPSQDIVPDSLILQVATVTGAPEGDTPQVRVPYVETDPKVGFVKEGQEIDQDQPTLNEVLVTTRKLGLVTHQSRESNTYTGASGAIAASMQRAITLKADNIFLNSPTDPTGIRNLEGIIDAGTVTNDFDPFTDAITGIEANSGQATGIIMDPASWGVLSKLKYADGVLQLGSPAVQAQRTLFGLPVYVTPSMDPGQALVISQPEIIAAVGMIDLATSTEAAFTSDSIVHRITWRLGWNVVHPNRLAKLAITLPQTPKPTPGTKTGK